jgi:DNA-binding NtrC family response regulator
VDGTLAKGRCTGIEASGAAMAVVVLCVEDDPALLELNRLVLRQAGYVFVGATKPDEAVIALKMIRVDAIVTDQSFAKTGIGDFVARLRSVQPGVPVVVYSGTEPHDSSSVTTCDSSRRAEAQKDCWKRSMR